MPVKLGGEIRCGGPPPRMASQQPAKRRLVSSRERKGPVGDDFWAVGDVGNETLWGLPR